MHRTVPFPLANRCESVTRFHLFQESCASRRERVPVVRVSRGCQSTTLGESFQSADAPETEFSAEPIDRETGRLEGEAAWCLSTRIEGSIVQTQKWTIGRLWAARNGAAMIPLADEREAVRRGKCLIGARSRYGSALTSAVGLVLRPISLHGSYDTRRFDWHHSRRNCDVTRRKTNSHHCRR